MNSVQSSDTRRAYHLSTPFLIALTLINVCNYMDRYLINAVLPRLSEEYGLSHLEGGRVASAFVIGYVIFSPIFGYLGDRNHRPTLMAIGVLLWGVATASCGFVSALWLLMFARILVGVGEASFGTIAPGFIKDYESDPIQLNIKLSIFFTAIPVGSALGYVLGGTLAEKFGWRGAFYWASIPAFILCLAFLFLKEPPRAPRSELNLWSGVKKISAIPMIQYGIGGYILNTFALTSIATFVASYGQTLGFTLAEINKAFGCILVVTGIVGTLLGGKLASMMAKGRDDKTTAMLEFVTLLSAIAVPLLGAAFLVSTGPMFLVLCALAELSIFAGLASINTVIVLESPPELVTLTQGTTILMINVFGAFLGPQVIGALSDHFGLAIGLQGTTVAMFACAMIWWLGTKQRNAGGSVP